MTEDNWSVFGQFLSFRRLFTHAEMISGKFRLHPVVHPSPHEPTPYQFHIMRGLCSSLEHMVNIRSEWRAKESSVDSTKAEPGFLTHASLQGFNPTPSMKHRLVISRGFLWCWAGKTRVPCLCLLLDRAAENLQPYEGTLPFPHRPFDSVSVGVRTRGDSCNLFPHQLEAAGRCVP